MENTEVIIRRASPEDKLILHNLLQFYLYDFSILIDTDVDGNGLYDYPFLDLYWMEPARHPFLIMVNGNLAGFALVREITEENGIPCRAIAEFFIMQKYRRRGIGRLAAIHIFEMFPGKWEVHQIQENVPAQAFWRNTIGEYTNGDFKEHHNEDGLYQVFQSKTTP
jgi:predicted acetyltransferase